MSTQTVLGLVYFINDNLSQDICIVFQNTNKCIMLQFLNTYLKFSAKGCNGIPILFCERNARLQFVWKTTKWTDRRRLQSFTRTNRTRWRHLRPRMRCTKSWYRSLWIQSFTWYRYCSIYITISRWRRLFYIRAMNKQRLSTVEFSWIHVC